MKNAGVIGLIAVLGLAACDDGVGTRTSAKQAGQLCALSVAQCQAFSEQSAALLPVLNKPAEGRSEKDDATVQLVFDTFMSSQRAADQSCTPVTGALERKAQLVTKSGMVAVLMGQGDTVCTLTGGI